jgi:murein DD-endopeptidase MepM/ murein hydrolase activator NlpD
MRIPFSKIIIIGVLFSLIGCSNLQWPPKGRVEYSQKYNHKVVASDPVLKRLFDIPPSGIVTVKKGETVFILSRRYGVSTQKIIEANGLKPPYRLGPGGSLVIPKPRFRMVKRGDSLYRISRELSISVYELARLNRLKSPFRIYVGQKLVLPFTVVTDVSRKTSRQIDLEGASLKKKNRETDLEVRLLKAKEIAKNKYLSKREKDKSTANKQRGIKFPKIKTSGRFNWPVRGKLSSIYGSKGKGLHNDGINIIAPRGASVMAAGHGVVAYSGNELRGFGNLLLIKHSGGWVTAYAHNEKLLVKRGDKVSEGQIIAKVGASGNVVLPQLHFEVRKGKRAINPLKHLKRLNAALVTNVVAIS